MRYLGWATVVIGGTDVVRMRSKRVERAYEVLVGRFMVRFRFFCSFFPVFPPSALGGVVSSDRWAGLGSDGQAAERVADNPFLAFSPFLCHPSS